MKYLRTVLLSSAAAVFAASPTFGDDPETGVDSTVSPVSKNISGEKSGGPPGDQGAPLMRPFSDAGCFVVGEGKLGKLYMPPQTVCPITKIEK